MEYEIASGTKETEYVYHVNHIRLKNRGKIKIIITARVQGKNKRSKKDG